MKARWHKRNTYIGYRNLTASIGSQPIGEIERRIDHRHGKEPWKAIAWLRSGRVAIKYGFARRGDAKRWVEQNQTEVPR